MLLMVQKDGSGIQPGQPTQTDQRDIPAHTALCSAIENGGGQRRCLPSWLLLGDCLTLACLWEVASDFLCIAFCFHFPSSITLSLSLPTSSPAFALPVMFSVLLQGGE